MTADIFNNLFSGGLYTLPYLIQFIHPTAGTLSFVNNTENITYDGVEFQACGFEYVMPDTKGQGASLRISGVDSSLIEFIENADSRYKIVVAGVLAKNNTVQPLKIFTHMYGSVSFSEDQILEFQLERDDRLDMVFTPYIYDTDNNKGNS
ncbi:MAG: hypothetical protein K6A15_09055 [Treponema sp.]|nr:hypothetical protein [Treponema sp.]